VNDYPDTEWFGDTTDDVNPVNTGLSFDKPNNLDLKIDKDDSLNLPPGNYYLRNLQMKENSKIYVTGPTTIYLEKALDLHDGQIVNVSGDPLDLVIILAGKKLHMKDVSNFSGYIFAPNAKAKLEKGSQVFGSLVAKEMELKGHSQFHADNSLPMGQLSGPPVLVQ